MRVRAIRDMLRSQPLNLQSMKLRPDRSTRVKTHRVNVHCSKSPCGNGSLVKSMPEYVWSSVRGSNILVHFNTYTFPGKLLTTPPNSNCSSNALALCGSIPQAKHNESISILPFSFSTSTIACSSG